MRDVGFEPRTTDSLVRSTTNEPPHFRRMIKHYAWPQNLQEEELEQARRTQHKTLEAVQVETKLIRR